jgi:hypothetical protein
MELLPLICQCNFFFNFYQIRTVIDSILNLLIDEVPRKGNQLLPCQINELLTDEASRKSNQQQKMHYFGKVLITYLQENIIVFTN